MTGPFYVYVYCDPSKNNEPFYVGKGKHDRAYYHLDRCDTHPLTHRILKMRRSGIEPVIRFIYSNLSEEIAFRHEKFLISGIGRKNLSKGPLLNLTDGGEGASGKILSEESRQKIAASQRGKILSPEHRAKIGAAQKGKTLSPQHCAQIGERSRNASAETREKLSRNNGSRKPGVAAKLSAANKGKTRSPESIARMSAAQKKQTWSQKMNRQSTIAIKNNRACPIERPS